MSDIEDVFDQDPRENYRPAPEPGPIFPPTIRNRIAAHLHEIDAGRETEQEAVASIAQYADGSVRVGAAPYRDRRAMWRRLASGQSTHAEETGIGDVQRSVACLAEWALDDLAS